MKPPGNSFSGSELAITNPEALGERNSCELHGSAGNYPWTFCSAPFGDSVAPTFSWLAAENSEGNSNLRCHISPASAFNVCLCEKIFAKSTKHEAAGQRFFSPCPLQMRHGEFDSAVPPQPATPEITVRFSGPLQYTPSLSSATLFCS
jgi:hypothetical protein